MTRSRSSELRKRYAAMQTSIGSPHDMPGQDTNRMKHELTDTSNFSDIPMGDMSNQLQTFLSPSNSSTSPFNTSPMGNGDTVSSVVSMLKGTIDRKKLSNQIDKDNLEGNPFGFYNTQDMPLNMNSDHVAANQVVESPMIFHMVSPVQVPGNFASVERPAELTFEGFVTPANQIHMSAMSREPSQSESSAAAPAVSTGFEVCDGPANSNHAFSVCESSRKHIGNGNSDNGSKPKEFTGKIFENNLKNDRKKGSLVRMGYVSSGGSVDKGDPTEKRRVERSRKMAEAKERNLTPTLPSYMQSVLKRCENLEKEVRSLKLNLSFMNRRRKEGRKEGHDFVLEDCVASDLLVTCNLVDL